MQYNNYLALLTIHDTAFKFLSLDPIASLMSQFLWSVLLSPFNSDSKL